MSPTLSQILKRGTNLGIGSDRKVSKYLYFKICNLERDNNLKSSLCTFYWNAFFQISRYSLGNLGLAEAILVFNITGFFVNFWFDFRTNLYPGSPRLNGYWRPRICWTMNMFEKSWRIKAMTVLADDGIDPMKSLGKWQMKKTMTMTNTWWRLSASDRWKRRRQSRQE